MKSIFSKSGLAIYLTILVSSCTSYSDYDNTPFSEKEIRDWENPEMFEQNRLDPRSTMYSFSSEDKAIEADIENNPAYISLDGTWKYNWVRSPDERPYWFFMDDF